MVQLAELGQRLAELGQLEELVTAGVIGPIRLLVLQPTPYCNLDCAYCYLPRRDDARRMSGDVLDEVGRRIVASPLADDPLSVVWHAGEPTVLPPSWFEEAFTRIAQASGGRAVRHSFQTNGVAIDREWIGLWRRWDVRVGLSIDGPQHLNDLRRRTRSGKGSFAASLAGLRRLRDAGMAFHVISVLTPEAMREPDALLDFFVEEGVTDLCFNVEEQEGAHRVSSLSAVDAPTAYRGFLSRIARRLRESPGTLRCREIEAVAALIAGDPETRMRNPQVRPLEILSVGVDGSMSTFSPEFLDATSPRFSDFAFGNVREAGPEAILAHPGFLRLRDEIDAGVASCKAECAYFGVCGGGAPANKFFEHGRCDVTETLFCRLTRKAALDALLPEFEVDAVA